MKKDIDRTKESLIKELKALRLRVAEFVKSEAERQQVEKVLRESEEKYRRIVGNALVGVATSNVKGDLLYVNEALARMLEFESPEAMLSEGALMRWKNPKDREALMGELEKTGRVDHFETEVLTKTRKTRNIIANATLRGDILTTMVVDVTERKQAEEQRTFFVKVLERLNTAGEQREVIHDILLLIREHSGCDAVGIRLQEGEDFPYYDTNGFVEGHVPVENHLCAVDEQGEITRDSAGNPVLECMCGNIICGRFDPSKPFFTEGGSFWTNSTTELLASTTEEDRLTRTRNKCNTEGYESVALIPLKFEEGTIGLLQFNDMRRNRFTPELIKFYEGIGESIGIALARKQAEESLAAQKELTDRILASTPNTVLVIDGDMRVVLANRAFHETFKVKQHKVEGQPVRHVLPIKGLSGAITRTLASRELQLDLEFTHKIGGEEKILVAQIIPMEEKALVVLRDITVERTRQEQLYHIDRLAAMGELASGFTHELNNPLTGVLGYSELVLAADIPEEVKKDVEVIHRNAQRAATIARNILAFARRQKLEKRYLNVNDLIRRVLEMRRYQLKVGNIEVVTEFADELPGIMADPQQLEQVFLNIILNAEQAMLEAHGRGSLTVSTEATKDMVIIAITDDGPDIPEENLRRVFDPFFTTKEPGKGTGLGLSIGHSIITEHGGRIYAESKGGKGATFFIELPL